MQGPNLVWHLEHGLLEPLHPKIFFIVIGTNDLFVSKCTDRFVVANILNSIKAIHEHRPEATFIIHGILPRLDNPDSKTQFLGSVWKRAQTVNWQVRKFCEHHNNLIWMQAGPLLMEETETRGRMMIDKSLIDDGVHPTKKGLEIWGDYIVKKVTALLKDMKEAKKPVESQT
jgi:lysophospholipase L1-like esterase